MTSNNMSFITAEDARKLYLTNRNAQVTAALYTISTKIKELATNGECYLQFNITKFEHTDVNNIMKQLCALKYKVTEFADYIEIVW